jgi:hypothetical protein
MSRSDGGEGGPALAGTGGRAADGVDLSAYGFDDAPSVDDSDLGWGGERPTGDERERADEARLDAERPPHWG